jgi:glyoxylase-like metal-dependent hydrolase (beta-lactamase superfamily II)
MVLKDSTREVRFLYLGWGHTPADGYVWLPKERILCTGDAAVNGPRNKLWDANLANWPKVLANAIAMRPAWVLPGHGDAGGIEILVGQRRFLVDLYNAVAAEAAKHIVPTAANVHLPPGDDNWVLPDMSQDIEITYSEISNHQPAGALPHPWK